eukprot:gene12911-27236_t
MKFNPFDTQFVFKFNSTLKLIAVSSMFKLCSNKSTVNLLTTLLLSPLWGVLPRFLVKNTIFKHFSGGTNIDNVKKSVFAWKKDHNVLSIIDESKEDIATTEGRKQNAEFKAMLLRNASTMNTHNKCVKFVPIKLSSLISINTLEAITAILANKVDELPADTDYNEKLKLILGDQFIPFQEGIHQISTLCQLATSLNLSLLLDAEESHRQPAVDLIARELSKLHNPLGRIPCVYNTYQMYLRRGPGSLASDMSVAKEGSYIFAAKVVRGAYTMSERKRERELGVDILWPDKEGTDVAYDEAVDRILEDIATTTTTATTTTASSSSASQLTSSSKTYNDTNNSNNSNNNYINNISVSELSSSYTAHSAIMIATHNTQSVCHAVETMDRLSLSPQHPGIHFAQIQGMGDHLAAALGPAQYHAHKLLSFGPFDELLPWLLRRMQENQDIFGAVQLDRALMIKELRRRIFGRK